MPLWCLQDNECLACPGGCEGYETKREVMRVPRAKFWDAMLAPSAKENDMDQKYQAAQNNDRLLYTEPHDTSWSSWHNALRLTQHGGISIDIAGHVITKTLKQWHTLAADDFKRQEEMAAQIKIAQNAQQQVVDEWDKWVAMDFSKIEERAIGSMAPDAPVKPPTFAQKLTVLLNENNKENGSNTPDFVLAEYLTNCLGNFEAATKAREKFYGVSSRPGLPIENNKVVSITQMDDDHIHAIELNERQVTGAELWPVT